MQEHMECYFDNSATTKPYKEVVEVMEKVLTEDFGNPSSMHLKGVDSEKYVKDAREVIAKTLRVNEKEILFTSGGTESNNTAIIGSAIAKNREGKHIITTAIEHPSVLSPMQFLEKNGYEVTYLKVDADGKISIEDLKNSLREDTILVSMMHINNEVGSIQPIEEAGKVIAEFEKNLHANGADRSRHINFHVDAIQSYGKVIINPKQLNIDLLSVSGHKINGPKGIGFLYIKDKTKVSPIIFGGGQQKAMRSGTENVPGIAGLALASKKTYDTLDETNKKLYELKDYLIDGLSALPDVYVNSKKGEEGAIHIVSASFAGIRSEVMLHTLEDKGIFVSAGSACSSNKPAPSKTLTEMGLKKNLIESTVRFSLGHYNTKEEIDYALGEIESVLSMLRKYIRK
ncbi:cysteine desulfurase [Eubacterium uniforme]|uniref:Cysteine desulfurase n=2 Tax=Eubacterium uniforme TaxID=39495 RepID=A0A1T4VNE0_9FIRM|nr:cysteine desulfurase [Eubacterium uniforme]